VISQSLRETLGDYLDFRHFFRQAYAFQVRWDKMAPLVAGCGETLGRLHDEIEAFLERAKPQERDSPGPGDSTTSS
jgi:hypothetical protein